MRGLGIIEFVGTSFRDFLLYMEMHGETFSLMPWHYMFARYPAGISSHIYIVVRSHCESLSLSVGVPQEYYLLLYSCNIWT